MSSASTEFRSWAPFLALAALLFVLVRGPALFATSFEGVSEQVDFGLFPYHLTTGLIAPPHAYLPEPQEGCALLWGAFCAPFMAAWGGHIEALRLCNLSWHLGMMLVFAALAGLSGGRRAVLATGALWAFAPPSIDNAAHFGWVTHIDAGVFTGACLLWLVAAARATGRRESVFAFAAGLTAAWGLFFYFDALFALLGSMAAVSIGLRGRIRWRWTALGAVVGAGIFLPGGGYWETDSGRRSLSAALDRIGSIGFYASELPGRRGQLLGHQLPDSLRFDSLVSADGPFRSAALPGVLYGVSLLSLWCVAASRALRTRSVAGLTLLGAAAAATGLHLLAAVVSGFDLSNDGYLTPVWPWVVAGASLAWSGAPPRTRPGLVRISNLAGLVALFAACSLSAAAVLPARAAWWTSGFEPSPHHTFNRSRAAFDLETHPLTQRALLPLTGSERWSLAERRQDHREAIIRWIGANAVTEAWPEGLPAVGTALQLSGDGRSPAARAALYEGAGQRVAELLAAGEASVSEARILHGRSRSELGAMASTEQIFFDRGLHLAVGQRLFFDLETDLDASDPEELHLPADVGEPLCRALGVWTVQASAAPGPERWIERLDWCEPAVFGQGLGIGLARAQWGEGWAAEGTSATLLGVQSPRLPTIDRALRCALRAERARLDLPEGAELRSLPEEACSNDAASP